MAWVLKQLGCGTNKVVRHTVQPVPSIDDDCDVFNATGKPEDDFGLPAPRNVPPSPNRQTVTSTHPKTYHRLPPRYNEGFPPQQRFNEGLPLQQRYNEGLPPQQRYNEGLPPQQRYNEGLPPQQRYNEGFPPQQRYNEGFPPQQQFIEGLPPQQRYNEGFPPQQRYNEGLPPQSVYNRGFPPQLRYNEDPRYYGDHVFNEGYALDTIYPCAYPWPIYRDQRSQVHSSYQLNFQQTMGHQPPAQQYFPPVMVVPDGHVFPTAPHYYGMPMPCQGNTVPQFDGSPDSRKPEPVGPESGETLSTASPARSNKAKKTTAVKENEQETAKNLSQEITTGTDSTLRSNEAQQSSEVPIAHIEEAPSSPQGRDVAGSPTQFTGVTVVGGPIYVNGGNAQPGSVFVQRSPCEQDSLATSPPRVLPSPQRAMFINEDY